MATIKQLKNGFYSLRVADFKDISKTQVVYALRNLRKIKKLLASEDSWLKQEYEQVSAKGRQYCLIGAKREADGKGENTAYVIMLAALGVHVRFAFELDDIDAYEAKGITTTVEDDDQVTTVQDFNDADKTDFRAIHKFLDYCISFADRLYQHKHRQ